MFIPAKLTPYSGDVDPPDRVGSFFTIPAY